MILVYRSCCRVLTFTSTLLTVGEAHERVAMKRDQIIRYLTTNVSAGELADKLIVAGLIDDGIRHQALVRGVPTPENI